MSNNSFFSVKNCLSVLALALGTIATSVQAQLNLSNSSCTAGNWISDLPGANDRVMAFAFHDGYLVESVHATGVTRVWDLANMYSPQQVRSYDQGWAGHHMYMGVGEVLAWNWAGHHQIDMSNLPDLSKVDSDPTKRFMEPTVPERITYYPYGFGDMPHAYGYVQIGQFTINDESNSGTWMSSVNTLGAVGFEGRLNMIGNLLIMRGDNEQFEGVAIYDISDPYNPVLLDSIRTTSSGDPLGKAYDAMPTWGHYIILAQNGDTASTGGGNRILDIIDFSDPTNLQHVHRSTMPTNEGWGLGARYAQFKDQYMFLGEAKVDMSQGFQKVGQFPSGFGEYNLPAGNLLFTAGQARTNTAKVWCNEAAPDTKAPYVEYHNPPADATNMHVLSRVGVKIHETLDLSTLNANNFIIRPVNGSPIDVHVHWTDHDTLNITPKQPLLDNTTYEFVIPTNGVRDVAGNDFDQEFSFKFSTGPSINSNPNADTLTADNTSVSTGQAVQLTASASDPDGDTLEYNFVWGDGSESGFGTSATASHSYTTAGVYNALVQVRDPSGAISSRAINILVEGGTNNSGISSSSIVLDQTNRRVLNVNPDNNTVTATAIGSGTSNKSYELIADHSGMCVAVDNGGLNDGANIVQESCNGSDSQRWTLVPLGNNEFEIYNLASGKPMDVSNAGADDNIQQWGTQAAQAWRRWLIEDISATHATLKSLSDTSECMSVAGASTVGGANVEMAGCSGDSSQQLEVKLVHGVSKSFEVPVPADPRGIALANNGDIWVTSHDASSVSVLTGSNGSLITTIPLHPGSMPFGILLDSTNTYAYVSAMGEGMIYRINMASRTVVDKHYVGPFPRALALSADGNTLLATRFVSAQNQGEVYRVAVNELDNPGGSTFQVIPLAIDSTTPDTNTTGKGIPNYLMAIAIAPDGQTVWVGAKKDNILRGLTRDGMPGNFQNTSRSIVSFIDLGTNAEIANSQMDIDNHELISAITFSSGGGLTYIVHQGNKSVSVYSTENAQVIDRIEVGEAPIGIVVDPNDDTVFSHNFLSRTVSHLNLFSGPSGSIGAIDHFSDTDVVSTETLSAQVLLGKQLFYTAHDTRIAFDGYLSCASCHLDGGSDERVWDFTDRGEGLRNTITLAGRAGDAHGRVHWSANFDEIHDFEHDIRNAFAGTGLMSNSDFGETDDPLGTAKAGRSADLDALAAYVASLDTFPTSPYRNADGSLTSDAQAGKLIFDSQGCASCHAGNAYSDSPEGYRHNVNTLTSDSGGRLGGGVLKGIDTPTLRDLWKTAPYLHDGSAATLADVLNNAGHGGSDSLTSTQRDQLVAYLQQLDGNETAAPAATSRLTISSITNGQAISDTHIPLSVTTSLSGVSTVEWVANDVVLATFNGAPYDFHWTPGDDGNYRIYARAVYNNGATATLSPELSISFTNTQVPGGQSQIIAVHSNKCVSVDNDSTSDGANLHQWSCVSGPAHNWNFSNISGNIYEIRNDNSGKLMDVSNMGNDSNVQQWGTTGGANWHRWQVEHVSNGEYTLKALSDTSECLDVSAGSHDNGTNIQVYSCNGSSAQRFKLNLGSVIVDSDNDGVPDSSDQCSGSRANTSVDSNGCELTDSDGDGINDGSDQCPNTSPGASVNGNGCAESQIDSDGDGMMDDVDQCDSTPANAVIDGNGCGIDSDNDGVFDGIDQCPGTAPGENVDSSTGCPVPALPLTVQAEDYTSQFGIQTENTSDTGGGLNVGWTDAGDYMVYSVNIPTAGTYRVSYRVASMNSTGSIQLDNNAGTTYGTIATPNTGGWQNWETISHQVTLPAGQQDLRIYVASTGFNINWFYIEDHVPNLLSSDGTFSSGQGNFSTYQVNGSSNFSQVAYFDIASATSQDWEIQMNHELALTSGVEYTLCFDAKATGARTISTGFDSGPSSYTNLGGNATWNLDTFYQSFSHTFTATGTDSTARVVFNMGQSHFNVEFDNIGVYLGNACGSP